MRHAILFFIMTLSLAAFAQTSQMEGKYRTHFTFGSKKGLDNDLKRISEAVNKGISSAALNGSLEITSERDGWHFYDRAFLITLKLNNGCVENINFPNVVNYEGPMTSEIEQMLSTLGIRVLEVLADSYDIRGQPTARLKGYQLTLPLCH